MKAWKMKYEDRPALRVSGVDNQPGVSAMISENVTVKRNYIKRGFEPLPGTGRPDKNDTGQTSVAIYDSRTSKGRWHHMMM